MFFCILGCGHNGSVIKKGLTEKEINESYSKLFIHQVASTGITDVTVDSGNLMIAPELKGVFEGNIVDFRQLVLTGNFDFDLLDYTAVFYDNSIKGFCVKGKVVGMDTSGKYECEVPIFEVVDYEILR